jgi:hypothetical protein
MEDTDPRLDFGAMNRRRNQQPAAAGGADVRVRMPTGAPVDLKTALEVRRLRAEAEAKKNPQSTLPVRTLSARQRFDEAFSSERGRSATKKYTTAKPPPAELHRSGTQRNRTESGDADSLATPMTGSTDVYCNQTSTAPSSAALTSGGTSNRHSRQLDNPAAIADAQAADWMRKELEKKRHQADSPHQPLPTANRPPSRARSIRNGIKEYIFPGSTPSHGLSRTQSRESLTLYDNQDEPKRSGSLHGWRSWGLPLRVNSRSNSRPGTRGRGDEPEQSKKSEVNLNRELPPLPSLDSWKGEVKPQERPALSSSHIASVMRAQDKQQDHPASPRSQHRISGSNALAVQYAQAYPQSPTHSHRSPMYNKQKVDSKKHSPRLDRGEIDQVMTGWSSTGNINRSNGHARHQSADTSSPVRKMSMDQANFSRKISMDHSNHPAFPNAVKLQKEQQKSRLKKVFSGWMLKKEKKDDWMQKVEREGVKEGVLVQDGTTHAPVVRY